MGTRRKYPDKDDAGQIDSFLHEVLSQTNTYRMERFGTWERVRLMKQGYQWLEPEESDDPTVTPFWKPLEVDEANWTALPVQNEMIEPLQNETARLQGNGSRPYIRPTEDTPNKIRAATMSKDVLMDRLDECHWREVEHEGCQSCVDFGTWIFATWWDVDYSKTIRTPVLTALKCPTCDFMMASPNIPGGKLMGLMGNPAMQGRMDAKTVTDPNNPMTPPTYKATATHCLTCPAKLPAPALDPTGTGAPGFPPPVSYPKLKAHVPSDDHARTGKDYFGRPLGEDTPLGEACIGNVSVFDAHPENQGIETRIEEMTEFGQATIRTLEWIVNHHPENGAAVEAENAAELMKWHPVAGATRHFMNGAEKDLFTHHALVREWHKKPWVEIDAKTKKAKLNKGRSLIMAGRIVLLDDDYMLECLDENGDPTGDYIPRKQYYMIPWEIREKEAFGLGAGEIIIPHQLTINTLIAQVQTTRHLWGSPKLLCEEGTDLNYAGFADTGYQSDVYYFRPGDNGQAPKPFGNEQMGQEWIQEYKVYLDSIHRAVGTMEAETGGVPGQGASDWSAQALMYLGEKAGERRKNRIDRIREAKKRAYKHMLQLIQEKYRETREYKVKRGNSERITLRKFKGADLQSQCDVQFDDEPAYDTRLVRQAAIKDGMQLGTITADTAIAKRRINRELGAPTDINEEQNQQVGRAIDEWCLFCDEGRDPAVNERADDHTIHAQQHTADLMGDEAETLLEAVDWNQIELALWGWSDDFDQLLAMEQALKANPPTPNPPAVPPGPDGQVTPQMQQAAEAQWQHQQQAAAMIAAMPKALELRILQFYQGWLDKAGIFNIPPGPPPPAAPDPMTGQPMPQAPPQVDLERQSAAMRVLRFRAHAEAHYRLAEQKAAQAAGGMQTPAAPGGTETAHGMIPGSAGQAMAAPGAGPGATTASGSGGAR